MKKTISITIGGLIFNIEEDAYHRLDEYLKSIKDHYKTADEEKEILSDIESGIAEKFSAKINDKKLAVTLSDIDDMIKTMGTVDEIKRETNNSEDAGVDSLPQDDAKKRLYRNPDDVIIAGVASGIAAYFGIDPVFVRITFAILIFANGLGLLAYLILWIVTPLAGTNTQKLEMKGKPVNLNEIQEVVKEKSKMIGRESKEAFKKIRGNSDWIYKTLNFPIKVIERTFLFTKKLLMFIWPIVRISLGLVLVAAMLAAVLGVSVAVGTLIFNINSPHLISDISLAGLTDSPSYYLLVGALYPICLIPLIFVLLLGLSALVNRNMFRAVLGGLLLGIWMLAIATGAITTLKILPEIKVRVDAANQLNVINKEYSFSEFDKLRVGGHGRVTVAKGDVSVFRVSGNEEEINRLNFEQKDGELIIGQRKRQNGWCFICFDKPLIYEIIVPELSSFIAYGNVKAELKGFTNDMRINVGESAMVISDFSGAQLTAYLAGTSGTIELTGSPQKIDATLEGFGQLKALRLNSNEIFINGYYYSRTNLAGQAQNLKANLENFSRLSAEDVKADNVILNTKDHSKADVQANSNLSVRASDYSKVNYFGSPELLQTKIGDYAEVKQQGPDW